MTVDLEAARRCANIAFGHFKHARAPFPEWFRRHLLELADNTEGSARGTESTSHERELAYEKELIGSAEAARIIGCSGGYVRRLARTGSLDAVRSGRDWRFDPAEVIDYAERHR